MPHDDYIREQALDWAVRSADPAFTDWDAFTRWLGQDPAHARAYDEVALAVADAAEALAAAPPVANDDAPPAANDDAPATTRRRWLIGGLAASVALVAALTFALARHDRYTVETAPGETRTVALSDGGSVALAGGTRLEFDRDDDRYARLERGQAVFTVRHDEARPFAVLAGEDRLVDAGTVFEVEYGAGGMQVAVSEGLVVFNPGKQDVRIEPGHMLTRRGDDYRLTAVSADQIGEWRQGRVAFDGAPLDLVAARLSRLTGIDFRAEAGAGGTVSGSVLIAPLRKDPQSLGRLLGAQVRREGDHWTIAAPQ